MSRFLTGSLRNSAAYVPGEQPKDRKFIKLNTNESPFPPSPKVIAAVNREQVEALNLYCDPESSELKRHIAAHYGLTPDRVFVSNGSDEILNFSFFAFCRGVRTVFPDLSYGFYKVYAGLYDVDYSEIPLRDDLTLNVDDYLGCGCNILIANPNAPTGICLPPSDVEKIVSSNPGNVVVIDEAYVDFGGESSVSLTKKYDNLLVMSTFSKSRSLAGARLGFAFACPELINDLEKVKYSTNPYNVNRLTSAAGCAAIDDVEYFEHTRGEVMRTREYTENELRKLGFICTDSRANFIFTCLPGTNGKQLFDALRARGILVRRWDTPRIIDWLRITVGTREQMDILLKEIKEIIG